MKWPAWPPPPKGNLLVYYQGGGPNATIGASRVYINGGPRLLEFDRSGKFLREIGTSENDRPYAFLFAQGVRVDPQDNIWIVDRASRMVVKFDPSGRVLLTLGRRLEAVGELGSSGVFGRASGPPGIWCPRRQFQPAHSTWPGTLPATSSSPTATATPASPSSTRTGSSSSPGARPVPNPASSIFRTPSPSMPRGNVYVADMGNQRIQVFDNDGTFKTQFTNVGAPRAICISPGAQQFLYSSNSNPTEDPFLNGEIYKMQLDGTVRRPFRPRRQADQRVRHGQ